MLSKVLATALFAALMSSSSAQGQTTVTFKILPPGHETQVQGVGKTRYYLLDEYLKLATFDSELYKLRVDVQAHVGIEKALNSQLVAKDDVIKSLENDKKILTDRDERLKASWDQCEKDLVKASSGSIWGYVVGAVGAAAGFVGLGLYLGTHIHSK